MGGRRAWAVIAVLALVALLAYRMGAKPRPVPATVAPVAKPEPPAPTVARPAPAPAPKVSRPVAQQGPQAPDLPFTFLGKLTEKGETVILLHGSGRTLRVRGVGPLTADYEVTAIHDNHIVLRYIPLGTEQKLELAARAHAITFDTPADSPQD